MTNVPFDPVAEWWKGDFDARMQRRAERRASPEFIERREAITRHRRHREIWAAVRQHDQLHAAGKHRVPGVGRAAAKAGY